MQSEIIDAGYIPPSNKVKAYSRPATSSTSLFKPNYFFVFSWACCSWMASVWECIWWGSDISDIYMMLIFALDTPSFGQFFIFQTYVL